VNRARPGYWSDHPPRAPGSRGQRSGETKYSVQPSRDVWARQEDPRSELNGILASADESVPGLKQLGQVRLKRLMDLPTLDFETWYRLRHTSMVAAVLVVARDSHVAVDATDEAFARALEHWNRVSSMRSPEGWTYRVAVNLVRRQWRLRGLHARTRIEPIAATEVFAPGVWQAVRSLPRRQREAIVLRYVLDLPEAEVARAMGVALGTAAATLNAGRRRLAQLINNDNIIEVP
jgi:RNA polymerase sigma-70 factor (ECF subfamily)